MLYHLSLTKVLRDIQLLVNHSIHLAFLMKIFFSAYVGPSMILLLVALPSLQASQRAPLTSVVPTENVLLPVLRITQFPEPHSLRTSS